MEDKWKLNNLIEKKKDEKEMIWLSALVSVELMWIILMIKSTNG